MKFNYKKIASVLAVTAMLGSTFVGAAAFSGSSNDYAVVYGASSQDLAAATDLASSLTVSATAAAVTGGEMLKAAGDVLGYGDDLDEMAAAGLDDGDLPNVLADGTFDESKGDTDNDVDYSQALELDPDAAGTITLALDINEDDANEAAGTYLFFDKGDNIYTYTLEFDDTVEYDDTDADSVLDDFDGATIEIMGKSYTITDATEDAAGIGTLELMGGSVEATQGEYTTSSYTVDGKAYSVEVVIISDDAETVKFKVNGETTDALEEGDTEELADGLTIGVREVMPNEGSEAAGADQVTFYLGANKLTLTDGDEVELNGETVEDYTTLIDISDTDGELDTIEISLATDEDLWIAEGESWADPIFGTWSINFRSLDKDTEMIELDVTGGDEGTLTFMNNDGDEIEIPLVLDPATNDVAFGDNVDWIDANLANGEGSDAGAAARNIAMAFADGDACVVTNTNVIDDECDDFKFIVISASNEARVYSVDNVDVLAETFDIVDEQTGDTIKEDASCTALDVTTISGMGDIQVDCSTDTDELVFVDIDLANDGDMDTSLGGVIDLTFNANTAIFDIVDANGGTDTHTINDDGSDDMTIEFDAGLTFMDIEEDSDTQIALDAASWGIIYTNADTTEDTELTIEYPEEVDDDTGVAANVYAVEGALQTTTAANVPVMDSAVSTVSAKNLLVVGGSCINTVAANLLTGNAAPLCGDAFSGVTTVGAGQYLIQVFDSPYTTGKVAVLLAGYEADQTRDAVDAFQEGDVAMTAGTKIVGPTLA